MFRELFESNELEIAKDKKMNQNAVFKNGKLFGFLMWGDGTKYHNNPIEYTEKGGDFKFTFNFDKGGWKEVAKRLKDHYKMNVKINPDKEV